MSTYSVSPPDPNRRAVIRRSMAAGLMFGVAVLVCAWVVDMAVREAGWSLQGWVWIHRTNPIHYLLALAPPGYAAIGWSLGRWQSGLEEENRRMVEHIGAVRHEAERLRAVIEYSREGVLLVDDGKVLAANPAAERVFGYPARELIGTAVEELIPGCGPYLAEQRSVASEEMEGARKDGDSLPLEVSCSRRPGSAQPTWVFVVRDITERKQQREKTRKFTEVLAQLSAKAQDANRAKSAFIARMSHEIRTPLNAILGYSELIEEEAEDRGIEDLVPDLKRIQTAGHQLLELIDNILDLSKIEAGRMQIFLEVVDVPSLMVEVEATVANLIDKSGNELVVEVDEAVGRVRTDRTKVRQILLNLLSNSAKFTEDGQVTVRVSRSPGVHFDFVVFEVEDTGIGMNAEQVDRIFREFTQADDDTTRKFGGTGLGLAISRRFTQLLGGSIEVDSEPGRGTRFTVRIPAPELTVVDEADDVEPVPEASD